MEEAHEGSPASGVSRPEHKGLAPGRVFIALVASPVVGFLIAYVVTVLLLNLLRRTRPSGANSAFRKLQLFSSGFVSFSHGANDAQKTMAIITLALLSSGSPPRWRSASGRGRVGGASSGL